MGGEKVGKHLDTVERKRVLAVAVVAAISGGAFATIVVGISAARSGFYDPTLASRMGSEALKFPIQLAFVATFSAGLASVGFILGRRVIEVQIIACAGLAGLSSILFYVWDVTDCANGVLFDISVLGLASALAFPIGWACARQGCSWRRLAAATLPLLATLALVAHVQLWHCASAPQQIGREVIAPLTSIILLAPVILGVATLGWIAGRRMDPRH